MTAYIYDVFMILLVTMILFLFVSVSAIFVVALYEALRKTWKIVVPCVVIASILALFM